MNEMKKAAMYREAHSLLDRMSYLLLVARSRHEEAISKKLTNLTR